MITTTKPLPIKPQYIPLLCPVCRGHRSVNWGKEICKACSGLGYIKVPPEGEGAENYDSHNK